MQNLRQHLLEGQVIPAQPLALDANRKLDERHQKALTRYYVDAGAGGLAVAVHTTQFEIRDPKIGLYAPVLELASKTIDEQLAKKPRPFVKVAGVCGLTQQATAEAEIAKSKGYHAALLSLAAWKDADDATLLRHCKTVSEIIPIVGFYLQPAAGGRLLPYSFWRQFFEIPNVVATKMAPFNRYQTFDVVRGYMESGRQDIALYTGNDDNIVIDLLTKYQATINGRKASAGIVGGLLGHWACWTKKAVELLDDAKKARAQDKLDAKWLVRANAVTDSNAVLFDAANAFAGCITGIHEVLRRQGLLQGIWCLNPHEKLSPGQAEEIDRVYKWYPELNDDAFVKENLSRWLS